MVCDKQFIKVTGRDGFVVVVVVVTDKEHGGNRRGWRRHARNITPSRSLLPIGEGKMAGLAAVAAVTVAVECQVTRYQ